MPYANKDQQREFQKLWKSERRSQFFKDKVCAKCGSSEDLELDHIDPSIKIDHKIWSWTESRRVRELAKCQVLCHNCHVIKTTENDRPRTDHGRGQMYNAYKCRCELCVAWKRNSYKK